MGIVTLISIVSLIYTSVLFLMNRKIGKTYLYLGVPTLVMVLLYGYLPTINTNMTGLGVFLVLSLMIIVSSEITGITIYLLSKKNMFSIVTSILTSILMILFIFNIKGMLSYIYIPILMFKLQELINNSVKNIKNK